MNIKLRSEVKVCFFFFGQYEMTYRDLISLKCSKLSSCNVFLFKDRESRLFVATETFPLLEMLKEVLLFYVYSIGTKIYCDSWLYTFSFGFFFRKEASLVLRGTISSSAVR